jgi:pimeloyl-ACP methyl ester carboxylesterase
LVRLGDLSLAVREWGGPHARPLVFWHALGLLASGGWLGEAAARLASRGFHVVAPDAPGFGDSAALAPERYETAALAALLWSLVDELNLERPVLMGHSWGGVVALPAAADRPGDVAALVLLDSGHLDYADVPGSNAQFTFEERLAEVRERLEPLPSRAALREVLEGEVRRPLTDELFTAVELGVRELAGGSLEPRLAAETRAAAMQALIRTRSSEDWPVLADAAVPVLLLLASEPAETRALNEPAAKRFRAAIPHADIRFCEGWGHDLIADGGPALGAIVADWLDRVR